MLNNENETLVKIDEINNNSSSSSSSLKKEAISFTQKLERRGVIYLSRIPPFMKPNKVRTVFEEYGEVTRLYLSEEDNSRRKNRIKAGGNGTKQFTEGWVEFADKKIAKQVALSLNNTLLGGRKRNFYHDDIWNIKYLKKFKWDYLTEKFAYERRVKENKLKASMQQAKRQNAEYIELLDQNKAEKSIEERKRKRAESTTTTTTTATNSNNNSNNHENNNNNNEINPPPTNTNSKKKIKRSFQQLRSLGKVHGEDNAKPNNELIQSIFNIKHT